MQAKRIALFTSAGSTAAAFGGILAYGLEKLDGCVQLEIAPRKFFLALMLYA